MISFYTFLLGFLGGVGAIGLASYTLVRRDPELSDFLDEHYKNLE